MIVKETRIKKGRLMLRILGNRKRNAEVKKRPGSKATEKRAERETERDQVY